MGLKDFLGLSSRSTETATGRLVTSSVPSAAAAAEAVPALTDARPAEPGPVAAAPDASPTIAVAVAAPVEPAPAYSVADAFAMLLAVEQGELPGPVVGSHPGLSEAEIDRIAARVSERLAHGPLNATVLRIVSEVSERLVREEIDRIRQSSSGS